MIKKPVPDSIFQTLNQYVSVSRETYERLSQYHQLLLKWQSKVNLIGPDTVGNAWERHFLDSLQLVSHIHNLDCKIVDMGTGAGFPGLVLSICGYKNIHLIESDMKKISFLREAARITGSNVAIHHGRIEAIHLDNIEHIISRACAPLDKLCSYAEHFVSHETTCLFHKGKNYSNDIDDAKREWDFKYTIYPSIIDSESVVLKIEHLKKRGI